MTGDRRCPICAGGATPYADVTVLQGHRAQFDRCVQCGFIGAREPTWLADAYSEAITKLDLGLLWRAQFVAKVVAAVLDAERIANDAFLDWAGGYGVLTRLMRDRGFDYRHHDPLCRNLFAAGFEGDTSGSYALVSAVEVLEHLRDPVSELQRVAASTDRLLVTTEMLPSPPPRLDAWWYAAPETGQHISFFSPESLRVLAQRLGYTAYVGRSFVHLFARVPVTRRTRALLRRPDRASLVSATMMRRRRPSLLQSDYDRVVSALRSERR